MLAMLVPTYLSCATDQPPPAAQAGMPLWTHHGVPCMHRGLTFTKTPMLIWRRRSSCKIFLVCKGRRRWGHCIR